MRILKQWVAAALVILAMAYVAPGIHVNTLTTALFTAIILGLINAFIRPIIILLTLPVNILTLGLFTLVINGLMVVLASKIIAGFSVDNLGWAILLSLILSFVNSSISHEGEKFDEEKYEN